MADITELLSKQLEKLVNLDSECKVDKNAFFDLESIEKIFAWYEETKTILNGHLQRRFFAEFVAIMQIPKDSDVGYLDYKVTISSFKDFLKNAIADIETYSDGMKSKAKRSVAAASNTSDITKTGKKVFIIHGHDYANLGNLEKLLKDRFDLEVVILKDKPKKSRPLIVKLEEEAEGVGYAFALFTPDDFTVNENEEYYEARPNVILELGWFFAKIGRENVSILLKENTKVPSDLDGIDRIEFIKVINEQFEKIELELKTAGIIE
ncbi:MAG: hypothetical protein FVQ81_12845 [Candidatus Glassbacteria bacterium]|nr:hypothetical protein [Candidatus Glassbacteria bacterium]